MYYQLSESMLRRVSQQLYSLERRDWELWAITSLTGVIVSSEILAIALPSAFLSNDNVSFRITVPPSLAVGLAVLLALLNTYLVGKRLKVRRLREGIISKALQKQLIEQQSSTGPLTEIYNRRSLDEIVLVALTIEGKFAGEGLQNIDEDDDTLSAMARELGRKERNRRNRRRRLESSESRTPETVSCDLSIKRRSWFDRHPAGFGRNAK